MKVTPPRFEIGHFMLDYENVIFKITGFIFIISTGIKISNLFIPIMTYFKPKNLTLKGRFV